jgi:hypothetical protein
MVLVNRVDIESFALWTQTALGVQHFHALINIKDEQGLFSFFNIEGDLFERNITLKVYGNSVLFNTMLNVIIETYLSHCKKEKLIPQSITWEVCMGFKPRLANLHQKTRR